MIKKSNFLKQLLAVFCVCLCIKKNIEYQQTYISKPSYVDHKVVLGLLRVEEVTLLTLQTSQQ